MTNGIVSSTGSFVGSTMFKVALVGRQLTDNENLGLGYLAAALSEAGFGYQRLVLNQSGDVERVSEAILGGGFELVGISLADAGSAYLPLALGELLRRRGFAHPITCGGSFATLARHWLLERYPWLHSVVRFAGEVPLVRLAQALHQGHDTSVVPGLTTRAGDGLPAPVLDENPLVLRPLRDELPEILGYSAAHIMATRGCAGRCGYCAPAALQTQEQKEATRAGVRLEMVKSSGVGRVRRRPVEDLCDEMAYLWQERGVRYFYFVDEHMLPYDEEQALAFLDQLKRGLHRRKVGRFGIGTMLRADRLTAKVVKAFAEVGLVRAFIGIEFASYAEGRRFGRSLDAEHARGILAACESAGVVAVSHLMLIHPYSTKESIGAAIDFLATVPSGVFEVTEMRVYHGTTVWQRLAMEGRLSGNPLRYDYTLPDQVVQRFSEIFLRLRAESFWNHSIAYRTQDAFLAHALGQKLRPALGRGVASSEMRRIRDGVVALYAKSYREALALAEAGLGGEDATSLITNAREQSLRLQEQLDELVLGLAHKLHTSTEVFSPGRAATAGAIAFTVLGGALSGCHHSMRAVGSLDASSSDAASVVESSDTAGDVRDVSSHDASSSDRADLRCPVAMESEQIQQHQETALQAAPCFNGVISYYPGPGVKVRGTIPYAPGSNISEPCSGSSDAGAGFLQNESAWENQVKTAISDLDHTCIGQAYRYQDVNVSGGVGLQAQQIWAALGNCGLAEMVSDISFRIYLDGDGRVVGSDGLPPEVSDCLRTALEGLVFPCLAGASICEAFLLE